MNGEVWSRDLAGEACGSRFAAVTVIPSLRGVGTSKPDVTRDGIFPLKMYVI